MKVKDSIKKGIGAFCKPFILHTRVFSGYYPIFMFHRVLAPNSESNFDEHLVITSYAFEKQIIFLKKHFECVDIMELVKPKKNPNRVVCAVTFDDGWLDNYEVAFPILMKHNIPATIFLCPGLLETNRKLWFDRTNSLFNAGYESDINLIKFKKILETLIPSEKINSLIKKRKELLWQVNHELKMMPFQQMERWLDKAESCFVLKACKERSLLNWNEIREMSRENMSFGSHGMTHRILTELDREEKYYEVMQSKKILNEKNINFVPVISFPNGNYNQEVLDIAEETGYSLLLTASINECGEGQSQRLRSRINISSFTTQNLLSYQLVKSLMKKII